VKIQCNSISIIGREMKNAIPLPPSKAFRIRESYNARSGPEKCLSEEKKGFRIRASGRDTRHGRYAAVTGDRRRADSRQHEADSEEVLCEEGLAEGRGAGL
jgi:hypothetical protein